MCFLFLLLSLPSSKPGLIKQRRPEKTTALPVAGPAETSVGGSVKTSSGDAGRHLFSPSARRREREGERETHTAGLQTPPFRQEKVFLLYITHYTKHYEPAGY